MKLPTPVQTSLSLYKFVAQLKKQGYKIIGSGAFANVYAIPKTNYVCKVGYACGRFKDDAYLAFLRKIDGQNPFFPEIKSVGLFYQGNRDDGNEYYVVHMEKLTNYEDLSTDKVENGLSKYNLVDLWDLNSHWSPKTRRKSKNKHLTEALKILNALYRRHGEDIHEGNVMWRDAKSLIPQLVITDPIA